MKYFYLVIFLCISCVSLTAQSITLGPKAGLNIDSWSSSFTNISSRIAFHLGGFGELEMNDKIGARAELLYSTLGAKTTSPTSPGKIVLSAISIPLLVTFKPAEKIHVHGGLQPSLILNAKSVITSGPNEGTHDNNDDFGSLDVAFILGGEYDITDQVSAGLRFQIGINDMLTEDEDKVRNQVIQLYAAFPLVQIDQ